jgi:hypothetical protein
MLYLPDSHHNARRRLNLTAMPDVEQSLVTYLDLACASRRRRRLSESDKLLVLAAVTATQLGWPEVADECRQHVLAHNPRHLVRRWPNIQVAQTNDRFEAYLKHVGRQYSPEKAEYMLACLGQRPIFKGSSAREMAHSLLAKIARLPAISQRSSDGSQPDRSTSRATAARLSGSARGPGAAAGGKRRSLATPARAVARRLRATKTHQEFIWWPYCVGLAGLAMAAVVWLARRNG